MNRRNFLKTAGMAGVFLSAKPFSYKKDAHLLSFSTLGCPDWPIEKIIDFAAKNQFSGIEIRGIQRQLDLPGLELFSTDAKINSFNKILKQKKIKIVNLGSSAALHFPAGEERNKNLNEAKRYIQLARKLDCSYVRVFPNQFPKDRPKSETMQLMVSGLQELGDYARQNGNVSILLETHGDLSGSEDVEKIMKMTDHPKVGIVWDVVNMWSETKEPPAEVYHRLKNYIFHTHLKDYKLVNGEIQYVPLGEGITPIFEAIDLLNKHDYKGYYSFEWEKLWHPEIGEPELAIAGFADTMRKHFK